jgi:hypothetical protein
LPVEYPGDDGVAVVDGQAADQLDGVVGGADFGLGTFERHGQFADRAAFPADLQIRAAAGVVGGYGDDRFVEQRVQELLAVLVGGAGCGPDSVQVVTEGQNRGEIQEGLHASHPCGCNVSTGAFQHRRLRGCLWTMYYQSRCVLIKFPAQPSFSRSV